MKAKSTFVFNPTDKLYTVQLRRNFRWWYLLPLLLLLLFIKCNRTAEFKVIDAQTKEVLPNSFVTLDIPKKNFFASDSTDNLGKVQFSVEKITVFKMIFSSSEMRALVSASHLGYVPVGWDTVYSDLLRRENVIELQKIPYPHIVVIDSLTRQPLENITVFLNNKGFVTKRISDEAGNVYFDTVSVDDNTEVIVWTESADYGDVRKYYHIKFPKTIDDTIALLSIKDGGLRGGRGDITVNLAWNSTDDLDLMLVDPCGERIYYRHRKNVCNGSTGYLDIDANAQDDSVLTNPQENIFWNSPSQGDYLVYVYFYKRRELKKVPFRVTLMLKNKRKVVDTVVSNVKDMIFIDTIRIDTTQFLYFNR